ncbi:MAG: hypothetical protein HY658_14100 [Actinobacteria bacterium]|nr:hypothetical protein [Actinomycetota bacterium]
MRRAFAIGLAILLILAGVGIGVGAYNAGLSEGLERAGNGVEVVRVVGRGYGYGFGFFLFPLFIVGLVLLFRGAAWRMRWHGHGSEHGGPGHLRDHGPAGFEDWHRRMHEEGPGRDPGSGGTTAPA